MRSEQSLKISRYQRKLASIRQAHQTDMFVSAVSKLDSTVTTLKDAVQASESKDIDLVPIVDAISQIKNEVTVTPEFKINPVIKVAAPVVNVTVPNDDLYARYKRFNSQTDPEGTYHGFTDSNGNWFIQRESTMNSGKTDTTRFAVGNGNANQGWMKRKSLIFKPISEVVIP